MWADWRPSALMCLLLAYSAPPRYSEKNRPPYMTACNALQRTLALYFYNCNPRDRDNLDAARISYLRLSCGVRKRGFKAHELIFRPFYLCTILHFRPEMLRNRLLRTLQIICVLRSNAVRSLIKSVDSKEQADAEPALAVLLEINEERIGYQYDWWRQKGVST